MPAGDSRKEFILATTGNFFGLSVSDGAISSNHDDPCLNNFLDDGNVPVLSAQMSNNKIQLTNRVCCHFCMDIYELEGGGEQ